jgi:hypothetical protein
VHTQFATKLFPILYTVYISFLFSFFLFVVCLFVGFFQTDKTKKKQYRQSGYGWVGESRERERKGTGFVISQPTLGRKVTVTSNSKR